MGHRNSRDNCFLVHLDCRLLLAALVFFTYSIHCFCLFLVCQWGNISSEVARRIISSCKIRESRGEKKSYMPIPKKGKESYFIWPRPLALFKEVPIRYFCNHKALFTFSLFLCWTFLSSFRVDTLLQPIPILLVILTFFNYGSLSATWGFISAHYPLVNITLKNGSVVAGRLMYSSDLYSVVDFDENRLIDINKDSIALIVYRNENEF